MARGRNRKKGKRERNGRLSRAGQPRYDKGTEHSQAMQAIYGTDGCDPIGRAYRAGLLGDGQDAKCLLDTARKLFSAYWAAYEVGPYASAIADKASGSTTAPDPQRAKKREEWLSEQLATVNRMGPLYRRVFDALVIDVHPDHGPSWLDSLLYAHRTPRVAIDPLHANALDLALEALAMIADVDKPRVARLKAA